MTEIVVLLKRLPNGGGLRALARASAGASGVDLMAAIGVGAVGVIPPGGRALVPTGFSIELPPGFEAQVRPRSGLALKHGVTVLNAPGTIDCDYRGEVGVILANFGAEPFTFSRGDRIAQLVVQRVETVRFESVDVLGSSARGTEGFGSTGRGDWGETR